MRQFTATILFGLLFFGFQNLDAQSRSEKPSTFGLAILGGVNFSQIDGDNFQGYDNVGIYAGLRGKIRFNESLQMRVELLYSQKGSKFESVRSALEGKKERHIKLNYAEIPILIAYRFNRPEAKMALWIEGGISIASMLSSDIRDASNPSDREFNFGEIEDDFESMDFSLVGGIGIDPLENLGFGLRITWGMTKFYEFVGEVPPPSNVEFVEFKKNYAVSLFALYHF